MAGRKTSTRANSGKGAASRPARRTTPAPPAPPGEPLLQRKYRELIRQHLGKVHDRLFAEFTGLHFHIAWTPPPPKQWDAQNLPTGCSVCCRLTGSPLLPDCKTCGPKQLARALSRDGDGHCFTCRLGVRNYWFPIHVRGETLGIAYLQASNHSIVRHPARRRSARVVRHRLPPADAKAMDQPEFTRAARFLRLIVQHVQTASQSDLRKADLTSAGHALLALEIEQALLHETLQRHLSPAARTLRRHRPDSHPEQLVQQLREWMEQDYGRPITLQQYARKLGMNATYLSALFSRVVGVPFKISLTELRMEKARALLGDPAKTVSDVAAAVGYGSEDRFRFAFKKATGLSPKLWRETMQTSAA